MISVCRVVMFGKGAFCDSLAISIFAPRIRRWTYHRLQITRDDSSPLTALLALWFQLLAENLTPAPGSGTEVDCGLDMCEKVEFLVEMQEFVC